ncbi:MAG: response regulator [Candidatus Hydrogenedentes bacterium]|nr:response regulator [Candidatus Hydrogenedentota bacterium]
MNAHPTRIVAIDDDVDALECIGYVLRNAGYETHCFATATEALAAMAQTPPDVVITDLMMETLDSGFGFARRLREDERFAKVPIIVVTAAASQRGFDFTPRDEHDLAAMKVDAVFAKPVAPDELLATIRRLLGAARPDTTSGGPAR